METELTTLCYIEKDHQYLMMHRTKKKNDPNHDLWLGLGGHMEIGESPEECVVREIKEESGLDLLSCHLRGVITFSEGDWHEYMFLFTADKFTGDMIESDEGELMWVDKEKVVRELSMWEGDKIFLKLIAEASPFFSLKLHYENRRLQYAVLNGEQLNISEYLN